MRTSLSLAATTHSHETALSVLAEDYAGEQHALPQPHEGFARTVLWKSGAAEMPDDEITILIHTKEDGVCTGFHEADNWYYCDGRMCHFAVIHWAHLPEPPTL